jgi:hypothetical protein
LCVFLVRRFNLTCRSVGRALPRKITRDLLCSRWLPAVLRASLLTAVDVCHVLLLLLLLQCVPATRLAATWLLGKRFVQGLGARRTIMASGQAIEYSPKHTKTHHDALCC